jgi:uncharacterized SAM-binding protein YcdF (DUF218 family)
MQAKRLWLVRRRTIWCPTWLGLLCLAIGLAVPLTWWWNFGEAYLSFTHRLPADVLVVEGWIGRKAMIGVRDEFRKGTYKYIVATGGTAIGRWENEKPISYAEMAADELVRLGIGKDEIVVAPSGNIESRRTYESALAARQMLQQRGIHPGVINVFTFGPHARRSFLVYTKVERSETRVGVIAWTPPSYETEPWWRSSERARELLTETAGYLFEFLFNSGRPPAASAGGESPIKDRRLMEKPEFA